MDWVKQVTNKTGSKTTTTPADRDRDGGPLENGLFVFSVSLRFIATIKLFSRKMTGIHLKWDGYPHVLIIIFETTTREDENLLKFSSSS